MLRTYRWRGVFWRFEDGKAPEDAVLVETVRPVTAEAPKRRRTAKGVATTKAKE